jgi:hypothetical protein
MIWFQFLIFFFMVRHNGKMFAKVGILALSFRQVQCSTLPYAQSLRLAAAIENTKA